MGISNPPSTPQPTFFCPECRASYSTDQRFCGRCGADMQHVSGLRYKQASHQLDDVTDGAAGPPDDSKGDERDTRELGDVARKLMRAQTGTTGEQVAAAFSRTRPSTNLPRADTVAAGEQIIAADDNGRVIAENSAARRAFGGRATDELGAWQPPEPMKRSGERDPWLGQVIDQRYKVIEVIGRGGMGVVYKVEHQRMGKIAAMKVLHGELANDVEVIGRFRREAEVVSRLTHPNTVQVFDFGAMRGALYLIMEYVRGLDLASVIKRDGPLPFERAAPIFGQICAALVEAHSLGVVHRDLKPENILVTRTHGGRDFVKVLDFGLAKLNEREETAEVTGRGAIVGTPYYMSPEQIRGEEEVDARSDIYSLGALMYKVLTGEPAFAAKSPVGVLTKHLTATLVPPSERAPDLHIAPAVDEIVAHAMRRQRDDRYATVDKLLSALESVYLKVSEHSVSGGMSGISVGAMPGSSSNRRAVNTLADDEAAAPSFLVDGVDYGVDSAVHLQRSDIDAYERGNRRRRLLRVAVVPILLAGVAAVAVYWYAVRAEPPKTREVEPNNNLVNATLIDIDSEVLGLLGRRVSKRDGDKDFYRVATRPPIGTTATIKITSPPNIDVQLELLDTSGALLHVRDEHGVGVGESIRDWRVTGPVVVAVAQKKNDSGALPVENVSDTYSLTVSYRPETAGVESEPDDGMADARSLAVGTTVTGYLDRRQDVDTFRFDGKAGTYTLAIRGASTVPMKWRINDGALRAERSQQVKLEPGDLVRLIRQARQLGVPAAPIEGLDEPYVLKLLEPSR